jgi:hypothetical protein
MLISFEKLRRLLHAVQAYKQALCLHIISQRYSIYFNNSIGYRNTMHPDYGLGLTICGGY